MTFACPGLGRRSCARLRINARFLAGGGSLSFGPTFAFCCAGFSLYTAGRLTGNIWFGGVGRFALVTFSGALLGSSRAWFVRRRGLFAARLTRLFCSALLFPWGWRFFRLLRKRRYRQGQ